jgi:hypothetical protein
MAKVIKSFKDKFTGERYKPGQSYEAAPKRIAFLQDAGYLDGTPLPVSPVEEESTVEPGQAEEFTAPAVVIPEAVTSEPESKPDLVVIADNNAYQLMTKKELFKELSKQGVKFNEKQNKAELISLLQKEMRGEKA